MSLRWQEIVVIPEAEEDLGCDCCGLPARRAEGRLLHREAPLARFTVRWRPGVADHAARHVLFLGHWAAGSAEGPPALAAADYRGGSDHGFTLLDELPALMRALAPWRPRYVRRAEAIGQPRGAAIFSMLDAIHVKDPRLAEVRGWALA